MVEIRKKKFFINKEIKKINFSNYKIGSIVSFIGYVRDFYNENEKLMSLHLEYYEGMTQKSLNAIESSARKKWNLENISIIHRYGELKIHDEIVLVIVASKHRDESFKACQYIVDHLKIKAPFWKKEISTTKSSWVEQKDSDLIKVK